MFIRTTGSKVDISHQSASQPVLPISSGLTLRAIIIGLILSAALAVWAIHSGYILQASNITVTHLPVAALFPFVCLLLIVNPLLIQFHPKSRFTTNELIVIFFMIFTASAIPGWAFSSYAISFISGPHYYASPENRWAELFIEYLPEWLIVQNDQDAVTWFFEGAPSHRAIPWQVWFWPLFWWSSFYLAIFIVGACLMVILRKQWVDHERLTFPLAQVPLMLVEGTNEDHWLPKIARNRLFWVGFSITGFILGWNIISFFDGIPPIPFGPSYNTPFTIARSFPVINLKFNFLLVGVAYFTRIEVLFSVWLFYLVSVIEQGALARMGLPKLGPTISGQHFAGFVVYIVFGLWLARDHLRLVWLKAIGRSQALDDSKEFFSYRTAVLGTVIGTVYVICWLVKAGMTLPYILIMLCVMLILWVGITRVVAETGLVSIDLPTGSAKDVTVNFLGSASIPPGTLTTMWLNQTYSRNWRTLGMASMAHCAKVGDQLGGVGKGVFSVIAASLVVSFIASVVYTLYLGYEVGASQFAGPAFMAGARGNWDGLATTMASPLAMTASEYLFMALGAAIGGILVFGHHRFPWWPLHPVGFGVVITHSANMGIFSIFLVWLFKALLVRFGGVQLYKKAQPFFIGMLCAYAIGVFLSFIVDVIWFPGQGHLVDDW
jgi:hypothetical protein